MKTTILSTLFIGVIAIYCTSCKEKSTKELLNNSLTRAEVYNAILYNADYSAELANKMMANKNFKDMMIKNDSMMKMMCMSDRMDSLMCNDGQILESMTNRLVKKMETDASMCDKTCTRMAESEQLKKYMKDGLSLKMKEKATSKAKK